MYTAVTAAAYPVRVLGMRRNNVAGGSKRTITRLQNSSVAHNQTSPHAHDLALLKQFSTPGGSGTACTRAPTIVQDLSTGVLDLSEAAKEKHDEGADGNQQLVHAYKGRAQKGRSMIRVRHLWAKTKKVADTT